MKKITMPDTFVNTMDVQSLVNNKVVTTQKVVTSKTEAINYPYSGPLYKSFDPKTASEKKVLSLAPGETKEFSDEEAELLVSVYPFLEVKEANADALSGATAEITHAPVAEVSEEPKVVALGDSELPTNFMLLKKFAVDNGCNIEKSDKKEDILRKLKELNIT